MPSAKILKEKHTMVEEISKKFKSSSMIILIDYRGINSEDITNVRSELRTNTIEYKVIKNSILRFVAKENNIEGLDEYLEGPTAITFNSEDYITAAKVLYAAGKGKQYFNIKAGIMDGKVVSAEEVIRLAKLPSKEMLLTQLATVLLANIRNLAVVLDQTKQKKEEVEA